MHSFQSKKMEIPLGAVWLMNSISEYKGKQELYARQSPQMLKALVEMALIESAESSNRIEGVTVEPGRLRPLVIGHARPRDRDEEEVAGYRKAMALIHNKHQSLEIAPAVIKELHRLCRGEIADAGAWKQKDNELIRRNPDGTVDIIFKPVSAADTPKAMEQLCRLYRHSLDQAKYPPLYAIACLVLDFLCIHPFRDGNGRVSRLLTLLALYHHDFLVGKYISLERIVEQGKETYYEALNRSSQTWHQARHDLSPWLHYFLGIILSAYKEFEQRAAFVKPARGAKTEILEKSIERQSGEFTITELTRMLPGISRPMARVVLEAMRKKGLVKLVAKGRNARWRRI